MTYYGMASVVHPVLKGISEHASYLSVPAGIALVGGVLAADAGIMYGVGWLGDRLKERKERRADARHQADLRRHVSLPTTSERLLDRVTLTPVLVALAALAGVGASKGCKTAHGWFMSGTPIADEVTGATPADDALDEEEPSGAQAKRAQVPAQEMKPWNLSVEEACRYAYEPNADRLSLGCFDLSHGLSYPVHPWSYVYNGAHRGRFNSQDIACFVDGMTSTKKRPLEGNPVYPAVVEGKVTGVRREGKKGVTIEGRTSTGETVKVYLGHLSDIPEGIAPGVPVDEDTVVGYCGMTGTKEPHLHFQVDMLTGEGVTPINPFAGETYGRRVEYQLKTRPERTPRERYDFKAQRQRYDQIGREAWNPVSRGR